MSATHCINRNLALLLICLCLFSLVVPFQAFAEPSPILTSWEDVEIDIEEVNAPYPYATLDAPKGGTYRVTTIGTYDNFHIFAERGLATHYFFYTYESLGEYIPDQPYAMRGVLAESFDLSEDRTVLKVHINPLAHFSDGSPVTAHDVVFTYNALQSDANPLYKIGYQDVISVVAESDSTVVYTFREGASRELPLEVCVLPVFAAKWWEGRDFSEPQHEPILASGPYLVMDAKFGVRFSLTRDPNYWGRDLPRNEGKYNFDSLIIDYYTDSTVAREAFFSGEADYYLEGTLSNWHNAYDVGPVLNGDIIRHEYERPTPVGIMGLNLNTRRELLQDKNVRHALTILLDFEWLNKSMYYDTYYRVNSYFTGHGLDLEDYPTEEELAILNEYEGQIDPDVFGELPRMPVTDGSGSNRAQMLEAIEILKESDWNLVDGKMVNADGEQMTLKLIASSDTVLRNYSYYAENLARVGIHLELQLLDQNQYNAELQNFNYDMCYSFIPINYNPSSELRYYWTSETADVIGSKNYSGIADPVVDDLIERMVSAESLEELNLLTMVLDRILWHGFYTVPGWSTKNVRIAWWQNNITPGNIEDIVKLSTLHYWYNPQLLGGE